MTAPAVLWQPYPGFQMRAVQCAAFEALLGGAAGPGKTDVLIALAARYCQHPAARGLFLRTTFTDLRDVLDRMHVLYPQLGATWHESEKRWKWSSGAVLELGYGESLREVGRYLGREFTFICFDEIGQLVNEIVWLELMSRVRSTDPAVPLRMRCTANPGGPGHAWLKRRFVEACGRDGKRVYVDRATGQSRAFVPGLASDNPALPESYRKRLRALPEQRRKQLEDGDWDAGEGLYFGELDRAAHVTPPFSWMLADGTRRHEGAPRELPHWWRAWASYDWGFRHWAVAMAFARDGDGQTYLLDTVWMRRTHDDDQARRILEALPPKALTEVYAGTDALAKRQAHAAGLVSVRDVFDGHGIYLIGAHTARVQGWQVVRRYLRLERADDGAVTVPPSLLICDTPGNQKLIDSLLEMVADPTNPEDLLGVDCDDEGKGGDDGPDCLRYGLASPQYVERLPEPARIEAAWEHGRDAATLRTTPDLDPSEHVGGLPIGF